MKRINTIKGIFGAAVIAAAACMSGCLPQTDPYTPKTKEVSDGDVEIRGSELGFGQVMVIDYGGKKENAELLAMSDEDGNIHVALNICKICKGSPAAYFVAHDTKLTCQNGGTTVPIE